VSPHVPDNVPCVGVTSPNCPVVAAMFVPYEVFIFCQVVGWLSSIIFQ
jgi:hypothetical protein